MGMFVKIQKEYDCKTFAYLIILLSQTPFSKAPKPVGHISIWRNFYTD